MCWFSVDHFTVSLRKPKGLFSSSSSGQMGQCSVVSAELRCARLLHGSGIWKGHWQPNGRLPLGLCKETVKASRPGQGVGACTEMSFWISNATGVWRLKSTGSESRRYFQTIFLVETRAFSFIFHWNIYPVLPPWISITERKNVFGQIILNSDIAVSGDWS